MKKKTENVVFKTIQMLIMNDKKEDRELCCVQNYIAKLRSLYKTGFGFPLVVTSKLKLLICCQGTELHFSSVPQKSALPYASTGAWKRLATRFEAYLPYLRNGSTNFNG